MRPVLNESLLGDVSGLASEDAPPDVAELFAGSTELAPPDGCDAPPDGGDAPPDADGAAVAVRRCMLAGHTVGAALNVSVHWASGGGGNSGGGAAVATATHNIAATVWCWCQCQAAMWLPWGIGRGRTLVPLSLACQPGGNTVGTQ